MAYETHSKSTIRREFFKPIFSFFPLAKNTRECPAFDDPTWFEACTRRCLGIYQSGRDFLQQLSDVHATDIRISTFFESLKSKRRLDLLDEVLLHIRRTMQQTLPDPLSHHTTLANFDIYAGDGHFIAAACHDPAKPRAHNTPTSNDPTSTTRQPTTKYATGHLYTLDLRTHALNHLCVGDQIDRKKEHDMRALKRQTPTTLRQGATKGRKVLYIWDRAGIDFAQWFNWKNTSGIYFLSREKDNMKLQILGESPVDTTSALNQGIISDQLAGTSVGISIRRITYQEPVTGIIYRYLTNLPMHIPPGVIAMLYKARWDIEKVFDEMKNKLTETKSWASTATAKTIQARLLCLTHNLLTLMEEKIKTQNGISNKAEHKRREENRAKAEAKAEKENKPKPAMKLESIERLSQRTVKFIRWLKNHMDLERDWDTAIAHLVKIYSRI